MTIINVNDLVNFQYFVVCRAISQPADTKLISIHDIINEVVVTDGESCELCFQFGAMTTPQLAGKRVSIQLDHAYASGNRSEPVEVYQEPLMKRAVPGPWVCGKTFVYKPGSSGIGSLRVVDLDGAFGPSGAVLSTFKFLVRLIPASPR